MPSDEKKTEKGNADRCEKSSRSSYDYEKDDKVAKPSPASSSEDIVSKDSDNEDKRHRKNRERSPDHHHDRRRKKDSHKRRKKHNRRRSDDYSSDSLSSSSSSSSSYYSRGEEDSSKEHRKRKRRSHHEKDHKKKKRKKDKKKKKSKKSKECLERESKSKSKVENDEGPVFGKYGIIKLSDLPVKQRSFNVWMEEVKGLQGFNGPKWEMQNYFKEYAEDYNTATLPHLKYYDYDKWEMEEYQKNKAKAEASASSSQKLEAAHYREQQEAARNKKAEELGLVRSLMSKEKIEEMKRKKQLQAEMAHAFKTGDQKRYLQLKARLEPEK
jgi:hypothetical protein